MNRLKSTAISLAIGLTFSVGAMAETMSKDIYKASTDRIETEYKADKAQCNSLSGNASDICIADAKGKEKIAKADLDARNKNDTESRYDALVAKAEANYAIAREKCDDQAGNKKDVCIKEAKAAETTAIANAKSQLKISEANKTANKKYASARNDAQEKTNESRNDATADKSDANYAVAKEKCDALDGDAKDKCVDQAKNRFGK